MKYGVDRTLHINEARDIVTRHTKLGVRHQMRDVRFASRHEIVEAQDFPAPFEQQLAQMRTEKTCPTSNDHAQFLFSFCSLFRH